MGKVVYRKEKKSRSPYPLLILGAVVVFGFSLVNLVFPKRNQLELEGRAAAGVQRFGTAGRQLAERVCPLDAGSVCPA